MHPFRLFTFLSLALVQTLSFAASEPIPEDLKTGGFAIGCQCWSFKNFTVFEALEKTAAAGGKVVEFFPGQPLSKEQPKVKFDHHASAEIIAQVKAKAMELHLQPIAYGVVGLSKKEDECRQVFEFAKALGIRVINTESVDALDTAEKLVKEYDIKIGLHDHPKNPGNPNYRMWDPNYILEVTKGRDPRIGSCADTGHWVRSGLRPVDCLRILNGRIMSSHLKDLNAPLPSAHDVPYGTGVSDIKGILAEFKAQNFTGPVSVEYEYNWNNSVPDIKASIDFVRAQNPGK